MNHLPPTSQPRPTLPPTFEGQVFEQVGKYARSAVMFAFQQVGGPQGLAEWAETNKDDFYTKLFPKIIAKESEVKVTRDIDSLMDIIDGEYVVEGADTPDTVSAAPPDTVAPVIQDAEIVPQHTQSDTFDDFDIDDLVEFEE